MAVYRGYFQGMETNVPTAVSQIIEQIFNVIFTVLLAYLLYKSGPQFGAAGGTAGTGIGALAGLAVMLAIYALNHKFIFRRMRHSRARRSESNRRILWEIVRTAFPIIIGSAIFSISGLIDTVMVSTCLKLSGAFSAQQIAQLYGQYSGKYVVLTTLPVAISSAMATASIPSVAASAARGDQSAVNTKINTGLRMAMLLSIPAAIGISVLGDAILLLLFPSQPGGGVLLQWGGISIIFLSMAQITTGMLQGIGHLKVPVVGAICGAIVKIPLNYIFISNPQINVLGAVFSTIICYLVASAIDVVCLMHYTRTRIDFVGVLLKPLIGAAVMGVAAYAAYEAMMVICGINAVSVILSVVFAILIYFITMLFIKGINRGDLSSMPMGGRINGLL
jgi:stage V sporulation protein B